MRPLLLSGLVAFIVVAAFLFVLRRPILRHVSPPPPRPAPEAPSETPPVNVADVVRRVRAIRHAPETQRLLLDVVRDATKRGLGALEELRDALRNEPDVSFAPRWVFEGGRLRGFPTLRSALIAALLEIPGPAARDALMETLTSTSSANEAYQICIGLDRRGEGGFTAPALDRAVAAGPGDVDVARGLIALAVRSDPEAVAAEVALRSPRGEDPTDPATLAQAFETLPLESACTTARQLLGDPKVTRNAKERYVQSLCNRGEPALFARMRELASEGVLDRELSITLAYQAIGSAAFTADLVAYAAAAPNAEGDPRALIRARYEERLREVALLIEAAAPADGPVRESIHRRFAERSAQLK